METHEHHDMCPHDIFKFPIVRNYITSIQLHSLDHARSPIMIAEQHGSPDLRHLANSDVIVDGRHDRQTLTIVLHADDAIAGKSQHLP